MLLSISFFLAIKISLSLFIRVSPSISLFINRRSTYSYQLNALFVDLRARIYGGGCVNKQDHYFFVAAEWGFMRLSVRKRQFVDFFFFLFFEWIRKFFLEIYGKKCIFHLIVSFFFNISNGCDKKIAIIYIIII